MRVRITGAALLGVAAALVVGQVRAAAPPDPDTLASEGAALLSRYIRIRSVNPPADTREAAAFLEGILAGEGIAARRFESSPGCVNLLARLPASVSPARGGPVMLLHHMDVVPVDPARWPVDPFGGVIRDGQVWGRGAVDMKGIGVTHLLAFIEIHRRKVPLSRDLLFMATCDEESGGHNGARWMIREHWDDFAPEFVFDEGGFGSRDVLSGDGGLVFGVSVAEKKIFWARLVASGTAGHGSQPIPDNANVALTRALAAIVSRPSSAAPSSVLEELSRRIGTLADNKFTRAIQSDTVSITTLRSGVGDPPKANVIPSKAEATLDLRLLPSTDPDRFMSELAAAAGNPGAVRFETIYRSDEAPVTSWETPMFGAIERAIRASHPEARVAPMLIPYGTDSNALRQRGVSAYGLAPMVLDAAIVASMHSDAEHVPVAELGRGARILFDLLADVAGL